MTLFNEKDGHLTDEGLQAVIQEPLNEMQRLEVAEHLSFCDECLVRYTTLLGDDVLMDPPAPLREPVLKRIKRRAGRILFNKYTTVAAAACLAAVLWYSGALTGLLPSGRPGAAETPPPASQTTSAAEPGLGLGARMNAATASFAQGLDRFFASFGAPAAPKEEQRDQSAEPARPSNPDRPARQDAPSDESGEQDAASQQSDES